MVQILEILQSMNASCFPKWSQLIFKYDLEHYPITSNLSILKSPPKSYLQFFEQTRGYSRPLNGKDHIWQVFQQGSLILYFDQLFFRMLNKPEDHDDKLLAFLDILGKNPVPLWDHIVQSFGACCIDFFLKSPDSYCTVTKENTDHVILSKLGKKLQNTSQPDEISRQDSRQAMLEKLNSKISSPID